MARRTMTALWLAILACVAGCAQQPPAQQAPAQQASGLSEQQKVSYALGMAQARSLKRLAIPVDPKIASQGYTDALTGTKPKLSDSEARAVLAALQSERIAAQKQAGGQKQAGSQKLTAITNKAKGQAFLEQNKGKPGVTTLASGLQYRVIKSGFGARPTLDDTVSVNYRGSSIDGKEFASTYKNGKPINLAVRKVIAGWREALQLMQVGSKWEIVVPAELAYGERMPNRNIGPNSTLIFELELVAIAGLDTVEARGMPKP